MKDYIQWRQKQNVQTVILEKKGKYYQDLINIEHSWSGRMDTMSIGTTFVMEAEQLLINAIELFEQGYFDCAYYSLRSAIDISTTMVFLSDMPDDKRDAFLGAWKETRDFPLQGQMIKQLSERGSIFVDMKENMPSFFQEAKELSAELNKYVHKQGLRHFYVSRNHPFNSNSQGNSVKNFEYYLTKCIGVVAVMRLAIDPFPILLMDDDILYRCFDSMTDPYSDEFANEYIGSSTIAAYKATQTYQSTYDSFISAERKTPVVFNVVKHQYIDSRKLDEILRQLHLMHKDDAISVLMVDACDKVVKTYCHDGIQMYLTDKDTKRKEMSWSSGTFRSLQELTEPINQPYGEAFISAFVHGDDCYFAEHNELLDSDDIAKLYGTIIGALTKMKQDT